MMQVGRCEKQEREKFPIEKSPAARKHRREWRVVATLNLKEVWVLLC